MMLSVEAISAGYGAVPVLRKISFSQSTGEILGIVGHNGMGKTTLMRTLAGILRLTAGGITLDGEAVGMLAAHRRSRRGIGYVPQGGSGFPALTVHENLQLATVSKGKERQRTIEQIVALFPRLAALMKRQSVALSGGERQILAVARAVIRSPRLLLIDELTEGVQPSVVEDIVARLRAMHAETGMSILLVDQDLAFVASLASRVLVMQKGELVKEARAEDLSDPALLGSFSAT